MQSSAKYETFTSLLEICSTECYPVNSGAAAGEVLLVHGRADRGAQLQHRLDGALDHLLPWCLLWNPDWIQRRF